MKCLIHTLIHFALWNYADRSGLWPCSVDYANALYSGVRRRAKDQLLILSVNTFEGIEVENLLRIRDVEKAMGAALLRLESQRARLVISKVSDRSREWALTCNSSINAAFPTWGSLKRPMSQVCLRLIRYIVCVHVYWLPDRVRKNHRTIFKSWELFLLLCNWFCF